MFNVETLYNIYRCSREKGACNIQICVCCSRGKSPGNRKGTSWMYYGRCELPRAGGTTVKDPVYFIGGPMMGRIGKGSDPVTKTTNAILVLPKDHLIVQKKMRTSAIDLKRAASICCQCNTCTDLCPRNNLGHPIDPARFACSLQSGF